MKKFKIIKKDIIIKQIKDENNNIIKKYELENKNKNYEIEITHNITKLNNLNINRANNTQCYIGILPLFIARQEINEYKKENIYFNITELYLKNKDTLSYYSLLIDEFKNDVYYYLDSLFNIKRDNVTNIKEYVYNNTLLYICILNSKIEYNNKKIIIDTYNIYEDPSENIYVNILKDTSRMNRHLYEYCIKAYDDSYATIPLANIYKQLM
jgi:hypothetical protein